MGRPALLALVAVLAAALGLALFWQPAAPPLPGALPARPAGGDFVLNSADGPVDTAGLRGKVLVLYFGYTYCPDVCPTALAATGQALGQLAAGELARVATIFVSVDPERDTPARLKEYAAFFHPTIVGVTGSAAEVAAAARRYGVFYARQPRGDAGYSVDHTATTFIVAADGRLAAQLPHGSTGEQILAAIRKALAA